MYLKAGMNDDFRQFIFVHTIYIASLRLSVKLKSPKEFLDRLYRHLLFPICSYRVIPHMAEIVRHVRHLGDLFICPIFRQPLRQIDFMFGNHCLKFFHSIGIEIFQVIESNAIRVAMTCA
jgi:hypothetical protein